MSGSEAEGFVLAGGRSSRMGRDKALIELGHRTLLEHTLGILSAVQLPVRIAGARSDLSSFAPVVPDDPSLADSGPLSGICSAMSATEARYAVFLSVDLPLVPAGLISYLLDHAQITGSAVTLLSVAGFLESFPVVIARPAGAPLRTSLESNCRKCLTAFEAAARRTSGNLSVLALEMLVQCGRVSHPDALVPANWLLNINSPGDLARAEFLLRAQPREGGLSHGASSQTGCQVS